MSLSVQNKQVCEVKGVVGHAGQLIFSTAVYRLVRYLTNGPASFELPLGLVGPRCLVMIDFTVSEESSTCEVYARRFTFTCGG